MDGDRCRSYTLSASLSTPRRPAAIDPASNGRCQIGAASADIDESVWRVSVRKRLERGVTLDMPMRSQPSDDLGTFGGKFFFG
jgi:hypothetical protein